MIIILATNCTNHNITPETVGAFKKNAMLGGIGYFAS